MSSFWLGLGYVAIAFGLCLLAVGIGVFVWRGARLIFRQQFEPANAGAVEGDDRHFRYPLDGE